MSAAPPVQPWPSAPLHGRTVLVTGGANGIGRGIAQAVLGAGGQVVIGDLDKEAGAACLDEWQCGARAAFQRLDVRGGRRRLPGRMAVRCTRRVPAPGRERGGQRGRLHRGSA